MGLCNDKNKKLGAAIAGSIFFLFSYIWVNGFDGEVVISSGSSTELLGEILLSRFVFPFELVSFVLLAALCYGVNSIVSKLVPKINFISLATGTTIASTIIISPFAFFYEPFWLESFTSPSITAIIIQGLFATAIANLLFFKIIELQGPVFLSLINFMIPLIAYFSGVLFLNEIIRVNVLVSLAMILFALYLNHVSSK